MELKKNFRYIFRDYSIKSRLTTVKNPQANGVLERIHAVLGTMLHTQNLKKLNFDIDDPWSPILASVAYAIRSTYHTTLGATPAQLIFGRDMSYPLAYIAKWDVIERNKQLLINKNTER